MKLYILLLLPSASALTSIRRLVEQNADALTAQLGGDVDLSCTLSMTEDAESCESVNDATGMACVWCPVGTDLGGCISQDMASLVNAAGIPHLHCGKQDEAALLEDDAFFSELEACVTKGYNGDSCLGQDSNCQYCVTKDDPTFGVCFSQDFVTEAKSLVEMAKVFDDDMESWGEVFDCDGTSEESMTIGSIADMTCLTNNNPDDMFANAAPGCDGTKDASGNDCQIENILGLMDLCVTSTQKNVLNFILDQLEDMGIVEDDFDFVNPMAMIMGSSMSGGGEALTESEDEFLLETMDEDESVEIDFGYDAGGSAVEESEDEEFEDAYDVATEKDVNLLDEGVPLEEYPVYEEEDAVDEKEDDVDEEEEEDDLDEEEDEEEEDEEEEDEEEEDEEEEDEEEEDEEEEDEEEEDLVGEGYTVEEVPEVANEAEDAITEEAEEGSNEEDVPEIVVDFEDSVVDSPKEVFSPNEMIAGMMNKMEERKELEDESGK